MKDEREKDEKKPLKVSSTLISLPRSMLIPSEIKRDEDESSKVIKFRIMRNLTDPQPTVVQRENRPTDAVLCI
jgi:hypothetical protein